MKSKYRFPESRIATIDICDISKIKNHIAVMAEWDVTDIRQEIKKLKTDNDKSKYYSFNAWLIYRIAQATYKHRQLASYHTKKREICQFNKTNISVIIEKVVENKRVPIPYVITSADSKSPQQIYREIEEAKQCLMQNQEKVVGKKMSFFEKTYYKMPGIIRRAIWRAILKKPNYCFTQMGNVSVTSLLGTGSLSASSWFIHKSIHPLSIGIGSLTKKPIVIDNNIEIREILNVTILMDHNVADGVQMSRFVKDLIHTSS